LVLTLVAGCSTTPGERAGPARVEQTQQATTTAAPTTTTLPVPADVADLAAATTMTDRARRLFFAATPTIEDAATFATSCGLESRTDSAEPTRTHTAGCFASGRIHLLAPDRAEARELLYVVAAHEMLHAAYAELGVAERARVDAELEAARAGNARLEERLKPYGTGPTLVNEVHSILGSEFDGLSPALEAHYAQYFTNRASVVGARQRTLGTREEEIQRLRADVDALDARIDEMKATQEQLRAAGDIRGYNGQVGVINGLIDRYNAQVEALNRRIDEYNALLGG
jgi:hypothetical protein